MDNYTANQIKTIFLTNIFTEYFYERQDIDWKLALYQGRREQTKFLFREFVESITEQEIKDYLDLNMKTIPLGFYHKDNESFKHRRPPLGEPIDYKKEYDNYLEYIKRGINE